MTNSPKKITLNNAQLDLIKEISGLDLINQNNLGKNKTSLENLLELGLQNAIVYLDRNALGQKLSIFDENNLFKAVVELQKTLLLPIPPRRIECYDISHLGGTFVYGSMITFVDGRPMKKFYRLFKCKDQNDDFANHKDVLTRRFQKFVDNKDDIGWKLPDLIIVDGGKGQLSSDWEVLQQFKFMYPNIGFENVEMTSLAKKEEELFTVAPDLGGRILPECLQRGKEGGVLVSGQTKFLVQRIRDEAHRFAITNNRNARLKTATKSKLEKIPGIGPVIKNKILTTFGSTEEFVKNLSTNRQLVAELIGYKLTMKLIEYFKLM